MNRTCDLATHAEPLTGRAALTGTSLMLHSEMRLGGAGRDRTDDLKLAKLALSQLSYAPKQIWWAREDLNLRPHAYQACALTN